MLHHSCSAPELWSGSTREMISSKAEVYDYLQGEPLSCVLLVGKIMPGSFAVFWGAVAYSQPTAAYTVQLLPSLLLLLRLLHLFSLIHSLSARTHTPSLLLAHSHLTHTSRTALFLKGLRHFYNTRYHILWT